ncbi:MAG: nucleotidyltransferase family protein, partial [Myxococcota bacterium]|nr:nucleotidyltransferase family protein [Myxococcota bacterium]
MQTPPRNAGISPLAWLSLRALLIGGEPGEAPLEEVARAAVLGEVEGLASQADPRLAPWLEAPCARRAEEAVVLFFAEARVTEALEAAGIDRWLALKGSASARLLYDDPTLRPRRDVDILIDGRDMTAFEAAAKAAGWADVTHATHFAQAGDGPYEREYLLDIGGTRVGCDVHRRLLRWREFQVDVPALLSRARVLDSGWRVCAPEDLLLHTAMHAANVAF